VKPSDSELAWCAGFLDGEGNFGSYKERRPSTKLRFRVQASQVQREPLDRLQKSLGGKVRGPYGPYSNTKQAYYQWTVWSAEAVAAVSLLRPFLCTPKIDQAEKAMELMA
jgi:hypothetical protein